MLEIFSSSLYQGGWGYSLVVKRGRGLPLIGHRRRSSPRQQQPGGEGLDQLTDLVALV